MPPIARSPKHTFMIQNRMQDHTGPTVHWAISPIRPVPILNQMIRGAMRYFSERTEAVLWVCLGLGSERAVAAFAGAPVEGSKENVRTTKLITIANIPALLRATPALPHNAAHANV